MRSKPRGRYGPAKAMKRPKRAMPKRRVRRMRRRPREDMSREEFVEMAEPLLGDLPA